MTTLVDNFLWQFRRYLMVAIFLCPLLFLAGFYAIYSSYEHRRLAQAQQAEAIRQRELQRMQLEQSNHVAEAGVIQAAADLERNKRLAAQQAAEDERQARLRQDQALKQAREDAAAKLEAYRARYINSNFQRKPGSQTFAVVAASESDAINPAVEDAIVKRLRTAPLDMVSSYFKGPFVSEGMFREAFAGSGEPFDKLGITNSIDGVVLAKQSVEFTGDASLNNLVTAKMEVQIKVLPISDRVDGKGWTFAAYGPGFSKDVARQAAEQRIIDQIAADTNMSLGPISSAH